MVNSLDLDWESPEELTEPRRDISIWLIEALSTTERLPNVLKLGEEARRCRSKLWKL